MHGRAGREPAGRLPDVMSLETDRPVRGAQFAIQLLSQKWLREDLSKVDLCSHGRLRLEIGGQVLSDGGDDIGISETALALLMTLERDHTAAAPVAERLVFHGCGAILMMGCPIGVDWSVRHDGNLVHLDDVVVYPTTNERDAVAHPEAATTFPLTEYRGHVLPFAEAARAFFQAAGPKTIEDDFDRKSYAEFWSEFDGRVERQRKFDPA